MWEWFHLLLREASPLPSFHPRPCLHVGDRVLTLAPTSKVVTFLARVFSGEMNLKNSVYSKGFVSVSLNGICDALVILLVQTL